MTKVDSIFQNIFFEGKSWLKFVCSQSASISQKNGAFFSVRPSPTWSGPPCYYRWLESDQNLQSEFRSPLENWNSTPNRNLQNYVLNMTFVVRFCPIIWSIWKLFFVRHALTQKKIGLKFMCSKSALRFYKYKAVVRSSPARPGPTCYCTWPEFGRNLLPVTRRLIEGQDWTPNRNIQNHVLNMTFVIRFCLFIYVQMGTIYFIVIRLKDAKTVLTKKDLIIISFVLNLLQHCTKMTLLFGPARPEFLL